jgi:hypothetical protein
VDFARTLARIHPTTPSDLLIFLFPPLRAGRAYGTSVALSIVASSMVSPTFT